MKIGIVLLQSIDIVLSSIELRLYRINEQRAKEVVYTSSPKKAIEVASKSEKAVIISSNVFDGLGMDGGDVAMMVKEANPNALFFIYSYAPRGEGNTRFIDGYIPKSELNAYSNLAEILSSINDETTLERLKKDFPSIRLPSEL
jgi:hypothetical protein